jgi:glycosyltransferase involved in cell wall biosynthesis
MNNRIHLIHFTSQSGGIEVLLPSIILNLAKWNFDVFIIRPPHEGVNNVYNDISINLTYGVYGYYAYWLLFKYARKNRRDIFHVFNIGPYALFILRLAGVKNLVYAIHGTIYWKTKNERLFRKLIWWLSMKPQYLITSNSEFSGSVFVKKVLKKTKPLLIYNPIDPNRFTKYYNRNFNNKKFKIVYSGRLAFGKNLPRWITMAKTINNMHSNYMFEVFGDGPLKRDIQDLIIEFSLQEIVTLKGFCRNAEEIYQNADLLIFLSEYESFGNVVVESILCETPVIAGSIPSMKEIFQNFSEFLISLDDNLEENVLLKIERIEFLRLLTEKAAAEFRKRFSLNQHLSKLERIYASFNS